MKPIRKKLLKKPMARPVLNRILPVFAAAITISTLNAPYAALAQSDGLYLAYPRNEKVTINSSASFIIGKSSPQSGLKINDQPVKMSKEGFFAHVIKLNRGKNNFALTDGAGKNPLGAIEINRPQIPNSITEKEWKLLPLAPTQSMGLTPGDLLILKAKATPGGNVSVLLKNRVINLSPANLVRSTRSKKSKPTPQVNWGQAVAYGKVFQNLPGSAPDLYVGFYKIQPTDNFDKIKPVFVLKKDSRVLKVKSNAEVSLVRQPILAQTTVRDAVVRVSPDAARLTPLERGVRLLVDGWQGDNFRCLYGKNKHVWIKNRELAFEEGAPAVSGPVPSSHVKTVNLSRSVYGDAIVIPLEQPLPYEVMHTVGKPNKLTLRLYGAVADTDWVSQQYRQAFEGEGTNTNNSPRDGLVESVDWKQVEDDVYELNINLKGRRQWGHTVSYDQNRLLLHIKDPPVLTGTGRSLAGLKICVDPGHGGKEPGAMGCSGIREAEVNLAISLKLKALLEKAGAQVFITRTDDRTLGLHERVDLARSHNADILVSVHNNSLPDGRDPWKEHGTSVYFYNKQASELSRSVNDALVAGLRFPNIGSRYQNLALTRPTQMLAILCEVGFMINPEEYAQLIQDSVQEKAAKAILEGLSNYLLGPAG
ncbi:hypothetical protein GC174_04805 [bacterium]|nr:hypothetical protein [bacterium]